MNLPTLDYMDATHNINDLKKGDKIFILLKYNQGLAGEQNQYPYHGTMQTVYCLNGSCDQLICCYGIKPGFFRENVIKLERVIDE